MNVAAALAALKSRVMLGVARAIVRTVADGRTMQALQLSVLGDELREGVERFQQYGLTSHPHPGAEAVMVCVGGNRDHGLVVAVDDRRYRLKPLQQGEVALYTDEGDSIILKRGRLVEVTTETLTINAGTAVNINTPAMTVTAGETIVMTAGATVAVTADETVTIAAEEKVRTETPMLESTGDITDLADLDGVTMSGMRTVYNTHTHDENNDLDGPTDVPNQLMEGA